MRQADQPEIVEQLHVDATPEQVWPLISDITLPVGPSPELQSARWLDDASVTTVGRRFLGTNRNTMIGEWEMICTVVECEPPRVFAWVSGDPDTPIATWRFTVEPAGGGGSTVRQFARLGIGESGITAVVAANPDSEERVVDHRLDQWRAGMRANLDALRDAVAAINSR